MATMIDGKAVAREIRAEVKARAQAFSQKYGRAPMLAVILAGSNAASEVYVNNKEKACGWVGVRSKVIRFGAEVSEDELISAVNRLNADDEVNGILVQLPLPAQIREENVLNAISPAKDVDGFHPLNAGKMLRGGAALEPCTPRGCVELLKRSGIGLAGANAVVIGRSNIVGKPMAAMLLREDCTVTVCHTKTKNLSELTRRADIVVCAAGCPGMLTGDMLRPGAAVIDVGISRMADGSLRGDADEASVASVAGFLTPVPGGVGPMTIAMLLRNTLIAAENQYA